MKYLPSLLLLLTSWSHAGRLHAQQTLPRTLEWPKAEAIASLGDRSKINAEEGALGNAVLAFNGAAIDITRGELPVYSEVIPLNMRTTAVSAYVRQTQYVAVSPAEQAAWKSLAEAPSEPVVSSHLSWHRKRPHALVTIEPFRRNPGNGVLEKLVSFQLELVETVSTNGPGRPKSYPDHSRLASGQWFRFTLMKDGVYKLTYDFLRDIGVDVNALASDRINIYGNHFGLLPFENSVERPTDLMPNAIEVVDGGDGTMNSGDYLLFYATGAQRWDANDSIAAQGLVATDGYFLHTKNVYTDSASYFIGVDVEPPMRIQPVALSTDAATHTVTQFNDRQFIDRDLVNLVKSGRTWYGEVYDLTTTYTYNFETPNLVAGEPLVLEVDGAARTYNNGAVVNYSSFTVNSIGGISSTFQVAGIPNSYSGAQGRNFHQYVEGSAGGNSVPVTITFNKFDPITSIGWLNYLRLNCVRELRMFGDQLSFRNLPSVGNGNITEFTLDQAQSAQRIWEITDPTNVGRLEYTVNGNQKQFRIATDSLRQFIAFRDANYLTPVRIGRVPNQDLHATALPTDLVIVCPAEFNSSAQRLAERRASEGLVVRIVTPQEVFNEFSCGARDASAIKRYMRMLYEKAATPEEMPRYLLLFGDGSYNNIVLTFGNQNWIPSYQTEDAIDYSKSYTSDDFFGLLDPGEGEYTGDLVDIGVGRLIVHTDQQAREVVDKLLNYDGLRLLNSSGNSCSTIGDGGIADWRTRVLFVSDDQEGDGFDGPIHMSQSDQLATMVETNYPQLNVEKLFMDAYQQLSTPGGERYPDAIAELREKVQKGLLLVNYVGHGGEVGWAHERLLDNTTILDWTNKDRLPVFMTATCEFSRWDDPARTSAGEWTLLNPNGGAVGLMSTTRLAYSSQNFMLGQDFYKYVFEATDELGRDARMGDTYRRTKVDIAIAQPTLRNHRNFSLLGDPSMRLGQPRYTLRITTITDTLGNPVDTLKALATVRISGFVDDGNGQPWADFNGVVVPTVYDKKQTQYTLANDGGSPFVFGVRKNTIYRGKATVAAGSFSFTFVVPKDINYQVGPGRVSCYAESPSANASGYTNDPKVGSTATDVLLDTSGPRIDLFLNDDRFVRGGLTDENPLLFAKLKDANGINTVGSSIGHDLLATLDENSEQALVLNDLYEADLDTYTKGQVRYRFSRLAEGSHTLRLKAWDTHNNSSESTTEFVVAASAELALEHVLNYPNPFTTRTQFLFELNRSCTNLNVQVQVFTVAGRLVKTLNRQLSSEGFRAEPLEWDGKDDFGDKLGRGAYIYRLHVTTDEGDVAEKFERLVILR